MFIIFLNISDSALLKNIFENNHLLFSLISKKLIAVGIVKLSFTITELWQFFGQKLSKNCENALLEKKFKISFSTFFASCVII
jgi:hypothetical protein